MIILQHEQRSPEWYAARLGVPTASNFGRVITPTGKPSAQIDAYRNKLIAELVTGRTEQQEASYAMERGTELESEAREYYSLMRPVVEVGLCLHEDGFGASPDGLVGDVGLLEIKCPLPHTHVEYLLDDEIPSQYIPQVMGQLLVCEREWCHFLSYHPDMKPLLVKVFRDDKYIATMHDLLKQLVEQVQEGAARCRK